MAERELSVRECLARAWNGTCRAAGHVDVVPLTAFQCLFRGVFVTREHVRHNNTTHSVAECLQLHSVGEVNVRADP
jgi:hypothetical protein